jgi:hypothetical protein
MALDAASLSNAARAADTTPARIDAAAALFPGRANVRFSPLAKKPPPPPLASDSDADPPLSEGLALDAERLGPPPSRRASGTTRGDVGLSVYTVGCGWIAASFERSKTIGPGDATASGVANSVPKRASSASRAVASSSTSRSTPNADPVVFFAVDSGKYTVGVRPSAAEANALPGPPPPPPPPREDAAAAPDVTLPGVLKDIALAFPAEIHASEFREEPVPEPGVSSPTLAAERRSAPREDGEPPAYPETPSASEVSLEDDPQSE